jgi:DNA recombination protein RmuC
MSMTLIEIVSLLALVLLIAVLIAVMLQPRWVSERARHSVGAQLEASHRAMLLDVSTRLDQVSERVGRDLAHAGAATQESVNGLQLTVLTRLADQTTAQLKDLATLRESMTGQQDALRHDLLEGVLLKVAEESRRNQELLTTTLAAMRQQISAQAEAMTQSVDARLEQISGRVHQRLEEGFQKTNETFTNVMARLAVIDEAQKKIDGLTSNVVSLQQVLADRSARGAFGEVQLEALVRDTLPPSVYAFQAAVGDGREKADCVLTMPDGLSRLAIDAKFPLSNYQASIDATRGDAERQLARRQFAADVDNHVKSIAAKYIQPIAGADSAVMFIPSEAVFAEIIGNHPQIVARAQERRVWLTSPTNLMAVLHTVRAVLRDGETRRQAQVIKVELGRLGEDFGRFQQRMDKLATHIRQAHDDAQEVQTSSRKITTGFERIRDADVGALDVPPALNA